MNLIELKERHAREIQELEQKEAIEASLPLKPSQVCIHRDHASIVYRKQYPNRHTFREAYEIFRQFAPVVSEHWKDGCLSCRPAAINDSRKKEHATMVGSSIAEIRLQAGKGYSSHALIFWTEIDGKLIHVSIELNPPYQWLPHTEFRYDRDGNCTSSRVIPNGIGEDSMTKWWSPEGSYQLSYYWADTFNFEAFSSTVN